MQFLKIGEKKADRQTGRVSVSDLLTRVATSGVVLVLIAQSRIAGESCWASGIVVKRSFRVAIYTVRCTARNN